LGGEQFITDIGHGEYQDRIIQLGAFNVRRDSLAD